MGTEARNGVDAGARSTACRRVALSVLGGPCQAGDPSLRRQGRSRS